MLPYNVSGKITEAGIRGNISVGLQYMESWLRGLGCVPINNVRRCAESPSRSHPRTNRCTRTRTRS